MKRQMQEYVETINFINLWLKGTWLTNAIILVGSIILLNLNPNISLIPTILLIGGTSIASVYMIINKIYTKKKLRKLKLKFEKEEKLKVINSQNIKSKDIKKMKTLTTTKNNYYYKNQTLNLNPKNNNPKIKKRFFSK